jgi:hypothetical protein
MTGRFILGLAALLPAALNTGPVAARSIMVQLCIGTGEASSVAMPLGKGAPQPGDGATPCCAKACHTGGSRKRCACEI